MIQDLIYEYENYLKNGRNIDHDEEKYQQKLMELKEAIEIAIAISKRNIPEKLEPLQK